MYVFELKRGEVIDLDTFGNRVNTNATPDQILEAQEVLNKVLNDENFAGPGNRNYGAVNGCIALHILGYKAENWFEIYCNDVASKKLFARARLDEFMKHVDRVAPYLSSWGPVGHEANALQYLI